MSYIKYKINLSRPSHLPERSIDTMEHIRYMISYLCLGIVCILTAYITSAIATAWQQKNQESHLLERLNISHINNNSGKPAYSYPLFKNMHSAQINRQNFPLSLSELFSRFKKPLNLKNIKYQNDSLYLEGYITGHRNNFSGHLESGIESLMSWPQFSYRFRTPVVVIPDFKVRDAGDVSQYFKLAAAGK